MYLVAFSDEVLYSEVQSPINEFIDCESISIEFTAPSRNPPSLIKSNYGLFLRRSLRFIVLIRADLKV